MYLEKRGDLGKIGDFTSSHDFSELQLLFDRVKEKYNLSNVDLFYKLKEKEILIPVSIFNDNLSCFETIVKYLRENLNLSNKQISLLIKRSDKTIYQTYKSASEKFSGKLKSNDSEYYVPLLNLANRKLSVLENIVKFLHDCYDLSYSNIAKLLHRDPRTVWTVYQRTKKKNAN